MEHAIDSGDTADRDISDDHDSEPVVEDHLVVTPSPPHSIALGRARRAPKPVNRLIEEANIVAYACVVAEEIESYAEPSS